MKPIEIPDAALAGFDCERVNVAESQGEYETLPALQTRDDLGNVLLVSRWELTDAERAEIARGGHVDLTVWTFGFPLQPVALSVPGVDEPAAAGGGEPR